jgi:N-acetylglucosamine transport system permease protein
MSTMTDSRRTSLNPADRSFTVIAHAVLVVWAVLVIFPLLWTLMSSFKTNTEIFASPFKLPPTPAFENYVYAWNEAGIGQYFFNTVYVVGFALFFVMLFGAMCAYVLARFDFPDSRIGHAVMRGIYYLMLGGLMIPVFLAIVPLFKQLQNFGLLNTKEGLIVTYVSFALPFTVFFLYAFFRSLPDEIGEAAQIDGANAWVTFFRIYLPMAKPGLATVAIMNFLGLWNQFLLPVALNTNRDNYVLSQGLAAFSVAAGYDVNFGAQFAAFVITVFPVLIVYVIFQRQLQGSVSAGTLK